MPPVHITPRPPGHLVKEPVYQQLAGLLHALVHEGGYRPGDKFLTEREASERFGVSRVTANKALGNLIVAGTLEFRKGVGTFVREGLLDYDLRSLMSFTRKAALAGMRPTTEVLKFSTVKACAGGPEIVAGLRVSEATPLHYFERLRLADGVPVILEKRYLLAARVPGLSEEMVGNSLYTLLTERFGLRLTGVEQSIRSLNLPAGDARRLRAKSGAASLWVHAVGYAGDPLWVEDTIYRGDRYEFRNSLKQDGRPAPSSLFVCGPVASRVAAPPAPR